MALSRIVGLIYSAAAFAVPLAPAAANDYFWPAHRDAIEFKVKAHAIRGTLKLSRGSEVTIADQTYQKLTVFTDPERLPKQSREVYLRADEQGLYSRYSTSPEQPEVLDLVLPAVEGKAWQTHDRHGNPSRRVIEGIGDCQIKDAEFKQCVKVSFETPGGAALAVFALEYGEIVHSRANGFDRRTINK